MPFACATMRIQGTLRVLSRSRCRVVGYEPLDVCDHAFYVVVVEATGVAVGCLVPDVGEHRDPLLDQFVVEASLRQIGVHLVQLPDGDAPVTTELSECGL